MLYRSMHPGKIPQPGFNIAFENLGPLNGSGLDFLSEVGRRLSASSQDPRKTSFLFQRLSVLIQRYNSVLILESFCSDEDPDL